MDAVEFLKKLKRMCDGNRDINEGSCYGCEIFAKKVYMGISCSSFTKQYPEESVAIIEKWASEHPAETRQSEFLKLHPNANVTEGILEVCPRIIDLNSIEMEVCKRSICTDCKKQYWLAEVE